MKTVNPRAFCAGASVAVLASCTASTTARDGIEVGRRADGSLGAHVEVAQPLSLPATIFPGFAGHVGAIIGFSSVLSDDPKEDLYTLDPGSSVRFELTSVDPGLLVLVNGVAMNVGDSGFLGAPDFDFHPLFNAPSGGPGVQYNVQFVLRDANGIHADSDPIAVSFLTAPACLGDADGSGSVSFADITSILLNFNTVYAVGSGPGDANRDGSVNFADITSALGNFNSPCL